jgi:NAD(P)-dependent dehydrogenase (short-subunit alcohol dehydrogenase family)
MAREYAQQDIRINVVSPGTSPVTSLCITHRTRGTGLVDTQLLNDLLEPTEVSVSEALDNVPMRRVADPLEIAKVIAFLLGPDSSYVTVSLLLLVSMIRN